MAVNYKEFLEIINKGFLPAYVFYGEERFLIDEAIKKLKNKLIAEGTEIMNYSIIEDANDKNIIDSLETLPFMSEHRFVLIKDDDVLKKINDNTVDAMIKRIESGNTNNCIAFVFKDKIDTRKRMFKAIGKYGAIVNFEHLKFDEAVNYVGFFVRSYGKVIKKPVAEYIVKSVGVDLYTLLNEVKKIVSYSDGKEILIDDVKDVISSSTDENVFKLVNAIGLRQEKTAIYILNKMILNEENPIGILAMIARQFRILIKAKYLLMKKIDKKELQQSLGIPYFSINDIIQQSRCFKERDLLNAYKLCVKCDKELKSSYDGSLALESLIRKLCN
ncbi:MAG: DNA polymerase III subunit delta [Thermoanaerobacterium sp.]|nr:DNA polymerase III subunit delta [Thermoanaerobacterium sp.]